ncbi:MAG: 5-deoxy-glucuronate isomerase [Spirochaetes bacterium]|nr:5-deoxy-glucuronate isomerase [Spirochaetota bacterium]
MSRKGSNADMLMDFGHVSLRAGQAWASQAGDERAFLLAGGKIVFSWKGGARAAASAPAQRASLFNEEPTVLSVPFSSEVSITAVTDAELYVVATSNSIDFEPRLYLPEECYGEERGRGAMRGASTRIVRTVFDDTNAKLSNLVIGEVIGAPGRWSSYPPHHHPQPEIYHYRFLPAQGFGFAAIGGKPFLLGERDTILIRDTQDHPQVTAPGYAMWYLWFIRHLDGNRYAIQTFDSAHVWVADPAADIWKLPSERDASDVSVRKLPATSAGPGSGGRKE